MKCIKIRSVLQNCETVESSLQAIRAACSASRCSAPLLTAPRPVRRREAGRGAPLPRCAGRDPAAARRPGSAAWGQRGCGKCCRSEAGRDVGRLQERPVHGSGGSSGGSSRRLPSPSTTCGRSAAAPGRPPPAAPAPPAAPLAQPLHPGLSHSRGLPGRSRAATCGSGSAGTAWGGGVGGGVGGWVCWGAGVRSGRCRQPRIHAHPSSCAAGRPAQPSRPPAAPTCSGEHLDTSTSLRRPSARWPYRTMPRRVLSLRHGCEGGGGRRQWRKGLGWQSWNGPCTCCRPSAHQLLLPAPASPGMPPAQKSAN